jgi:hypothetical protein
MQRDASILAFTNPLVKALGSRRSAAPPGDLPALATKLDCFLGRSVNLDGLAASILEGNADLCGFAFLNGVAA